MEITVKDEFNNKTIREYLSFYHVAKPMIYKISINHSTLVNGIEKGFDEKLNTGDTIFFDLESIEENNTKPYKDKINII